VTKDNDFNDLVTFLGFPPKVIWIRRGNCSTNDIIILLNSKLEMIEAFITDTSNDILTFYNLIFKQYIFFLINRHFPFRLKSTHLSNPNPQMTNGLNPVNP